MYKYYAPCRADKRVTTVRVNCYRPCTNNAGADYSAACGMAATLPWLLVTLILAKAFAPAVPLGSAFTGLRRLLLVAVTCRVTNLAMPKRAWLRGWLLVCRHCKCY